MNANPTTSAFVHRSKGTPEIHARHALSELEFGLRGIVQILPRIIHQQSDTSFAQVLHAQGSRMIELRSALQGFAQENGLAPASSRCEELDILLNELRGKQVRVKYGRSLPSAVFPPLRKLWDVLLQRWTVLVDTSRKFLDQRALATVEALYEEARRMEAVLLEVTLAQNGKTALR